MPPAGIEPAVSERVTLDRSATGMAAACIDDRSNCVMIVGSWGAMYAEKNLFGCHFVTNLTWIGLRSNLGLRGERPATKYRAVSSCLNSIQVPCCLKLSKQYTSTVLSQVV